MKCLVLTLLLVVPVVSIGPTPAMAAPPAKRSLEEIVPKRVQISVAGDHLFAVAALHVRPEDVGESSWARWDGDGDRRLSPEEQAPLIEHIVGVQLLSQAVAIARRGVEWGAFSVARMSKASGVLLLSQPLELKVSGRLPLSEEDSERAFVVYVPPRLPDGIVPLRISLAKGMSFVGVAGTRAEQRGPRRIEAVLSRANPAIWGTIKLQRLKR
jgi:hypothetical protein